MSQERNEVNGRNINFLHNDSIFPYALLNDPDGSYYFKNGHNYQDSLTHYRFTGKRKNTVTTIDTILIDQKEPLKINSCFSSFQKDSNSYKNTYDSYWIKSEDYNNTGTKLRFELEYSYILSRLGMKGLKEKNIIRTIRSYSKQESIFLEVYNLNLNYENPILSFTEGMVMKNGDFKLLNNGSCDIKTPKHKKWLDEGLEYLKQQDKAQFIVLDGAEHYLTEQSTPYSYYVIMRPHINKDGQIPKGAITWILRNLYLRNIN